MTATGNSAGPGIQTGSRGNTISRAITTAGVINKNVVGVYASPDRSSEQVSQAILGQPVSAQEESADWISIKTTDDYCGWIESRWFTRDNQSHSYASAGAIARVTNLFANVLAWAAPGSDIITKAVIGTELEVVDEPDDWVHVRLPDGGRGAVRRFAVDLADRAVRPLPLAPTGGEIAATARRFIGVPYLWGGITPFGLDCSGFVQLVYKINNLLLPRDAYMQAEDDRFTPVTGSEYSPGDLLFFTSPNAAQSSGRISHVGIALDSGRFIHSSGGAGVVISELQDPYYSSILTTARRIK